MGTNVHLAAVPYIYWDRWAVYGLAAQLLEVQWLGRDINVDDRTGCDEWVPG